MDEDGGSSYALPLYFPETEAAHNTRRFLPGFGTDLSFKAIMKVLRNGRGVIKATSGIIVPLAGRSGP
jgi:hypothetical protein